MDELEQLRRENAELKLALAQSRASSQAGLTKHKMSSTGLIIKAANGKTQIYNLAGQIVYVISDGELCKSGTYVLVPPLANPASNGFDE